ncbi:Nucleoid-associated protein [Anaerolineae bacterium]|nr:YbaB/EbfC family nucleoid-associated protein [Anaerolinea sp.]MCC6975790.1 YbaB/EbfC family nucleoid-associated protein [Anaerolineae bacterium]CAG0967394.1 Nucleoid-associated protein [Anaerolineae bacterium]
MTKRRGSGFGGPGASGNPQGMLKQLQKMQEDMVKAQEALANETLEIAAGGGAVKVVISGHQRVQSISIDPAALDTSDPEWKNDLQDLLVVAINQAIEESQKRAAERMESVSGGMGDILGSGLGGLLGG